MILKNNFNLKKCKCNYLLSFPLVVLSVFFMGCEKDSSLIDLNQEHPAINDLVISDAEVINYLPEVVNGRFVFCDSDSFNKVVDWITRNQENHEKIETQLSYSGFSSLKTIFEEGMSIISIDIDSYSEDDLISILGEFNSYITRYPQVFYNIESDGAPDYFMQTSNVISYVANELGIYQVGDTIYRVSYNREYQIIDGDETKIPQIIFDDGNLNSCDKVVVVEFNNNTDKTVRKTYTITISSNQRIRIQFISFLSQNRWHYDLRVTGQTRSLNIWWNNLSRLCVCEMEKSSTIWRISGVNYYWEDANVWKFTHGWGPDATYTIIETPGSTRISYTPSYMDYTVSCKLSAHGSDYIWNRPNVFADGVGWNN